MLQTMEHLTEAVYRMTGTSVKVEARVNSIRQFLKCFARFLKYFKRRSVLFGHVPGLFQHL